MSKLDLLRLFFYVEKLKIGGLKYDKLTSEVNNPSLLNDFRNKELPRERKTEYLQLESIKNTMKQHAIEKQKDFDHPKIDFEELELIYIGNRNKDHLLTNQFVNYLLWLIYRHHAPNKAYNFLLVLIMVLMIIEIVKSKLI